MVGMLLLAVYDFITDVGMARQVWEMWVEYCTISFEIIFTDIDLDSFTRIHLPPPFERGWFMW